MKLVAEYVSSGHPDRLADAIVESIVTFIVSKDKEALCGLECAVHTNKVFVDGRIAAGKDKTVITNDDIKNIVKETYKGAGYYAKGSSPWHPLPDELEIILDVCIEPLSESERSIRKYSDDQNIVTGYATNIKEAKYLPIEHYLAHRIGYYINNNWYTDFGPDFKILVEINKEGNKYSWDRITLSIQHKSSFKFSDIFDEIYSDIEYCLSLELTNFNHFFNSLKNIEKTKVLVNGAGDFIQGGPLGDNGLSGKKLVVDFYGPSVPIGGGAICGKDPHKIDVCGAFRARQLAIELVRKLNCYSVFTRLAWSPGEETPYLIEAYEIDEFGTKTSIDVSKIHPKDWFSIECINKDLNLVALDRRKKLLAGYMFREWPKIGAK